MGYFSYNTKVGTTTKNGKLLGGESFTVGQSVTFSYSDTGPSSSPSRHVNTLYLFIGSNQYIVATLDSNCTSFSVGGTITIPNVGSTNCYLQCMDGGNVARSPIFTVIDPNVAPNSPSWISYATTPIKYGMTIPINWSAATDPDGNAVTYILEFYNGSSWAQIYNGVGTSYNYVLPYLNTSSALFRVCAYDGKKYSGYTQGIPFTIYTNSTPTIDGQATIDLGNKNTPFSVSYVISDVDTLDSLKVIEKLNGNIIRTQDNAPRGQANNITVDRSTLNNLLLNSQSNIEVSVDDGKGGISYKRWYFTRVNLAPEISNTDKNLGIASNVTEKYICHDVEGNTFSIVEKVDNTVIKTFVGVDGTEYTTDIPKSIWFKLVNGQHTYTITTTDSLGSSTTRAFTFTKTETVIESTGLTNIVPTDSAATKILLTPNWSGKENVDILFEVCNNAFDATPTWENASSQTLLNKPYIFTNKVKTATKWGIDIRFKLTLKTGVTAGIDFYGLGGAFQ